jgi:hypothetical protein
VIGLEVNAEKTKSMVMYLERSTGQNENIKIVNKFFERVKGFKYLEKTLTDQNSIYEEIKSRLNSGDACYHSVQNLVPSSLLSTNMKFKSIQNYNYACFVWA